MSHGWIRVPKKSFLQLKLAFTTSPDIISTSPKSFLTSRIDFTVLLLLKLLKKYQLKTEFTGPIAKSISPGLANITFLARWGGQT